MGKEVSRSITAQCSEAGAALNLSIDPAEITDKLKEQLRKRLLKRGVSLHWSIMDSAPELAIRVVSIDQGNQLLRYLIPFIAPALVEVEGEVSLAGRPKKAFHFTQKAHIGLFGGSPRSMLTVCAQGVANKIAGEVARCTKT